MITTVVQFAARYRRRCFLRNDLRNPEGFRKATEKPMNKFVEKFAEVAKEYYENTLADVDEN